MSFIISCDKEENNDTVNVDCKQLKAGIIDYNNDILNEEITKFLNDLSPTPTEDDNIGHEININTLIERINQCDSISAELFCYACIKTYPAQSEITLETDSMGILVSRIIDIITPDDDKLKYGNIHASYTH